MKKYFYLITLLLMLCVSQAPALQLSEVTPQLTRSQADRTLSKDYTYKVLDDFTIRRTWVLSSNRRISLDFNPQNEKLLMIMLEYGTGIDQQKAAADVRRITGAGKTKWKRMDKKKAEKYDVPVNSHNAKSGSCYAFMEMSKSNKCRRVMIYTSLPSSNRSNLGTADTRSSGETALGTRAGASVGKVLAEQEHLRKNTPLASSRKQTASQRPASAPVRSHSPSAASDSAADSSPQSTAESSSLASHEDVSEEELIEDDFEEIKVESRFSLSALQASVGLKGVSPTMLIVGALVIIVLLTLIAMLRKSGERKRLSRYRSGRY